MSNIIQRQPNERVLTVPLFGTGCPHQHGKQAQQRQEEQDEMPTPAIVIRKKGVGHIESNADKRRELKESFEKELGVEDQMNEEPLRVMVSKRGEVYQLPEDK